MRPTSDSARACLNDYSTYFTHLRKAVESDPELSLDEVRTILERWGDHTSEPDGVGYVAITAAGVPAISAVPHGCAGDRVLICSHGGGYSCGSMHSHRKLYAHIAKAVGCRALIVQYRLVPEHPHPAAVDDVFAVYRWLLAAGIAPRHIALIGDSAGGALSITALLRARDHGLPMPAATIPLSPWIDLEATSSTYDENQDTDVVNSRALVVSMGAVVVGSTGDPHDPLMAPLYADLKNFPPMYIQVGGAETFLGDAHQLAALARNAGVDVKLDIFDQMQHCFQMLAGNAPQADEAINGIAAWLRPKLDLP